MLLIHKWIEGETSLDEFCIKRFGEKPRFVETIGKVGYNAKVYKCYKEKEEGYYTQMFLLTMPHEKGTITDIQTILRMTYDEIRADKSSILI